MEEKEVLDFEKICRLCLLEKGSLLRIFAKKKRNNTTPLPIRIMTCTSLELYQGDGLPCKICPKCLWDVNQAYSFRERCEAANTRLLQYVERTKNGTSPSVHDNDIEGPTPAEYLDQQITIDEKRGEGEMKTEGGGGEIKQEHDDRIVIKSEELLMNDEDDDDTPISALIVRSKHQQQQQVAAEHEDYECENDAPCPEDSESDLETEPAAALVETEMREDERSAGDNGTGHTVTLTVPTLPILNTPRPAMSVRKFLETEFCSDPSYNTHKKFYPLGTSKKKQKVEKGVKPARDGWEPFNGIHDLKPRRKYAPREKNLISNNSSPIIEQDGSKSKFRACTHCGKVVLGKNMGIHVKIHVGNKSHLCDICGKSFLYKKTLETHKRVHSGERPCVCKICDKTFRSSSRLSDHMSTHTGRKPFICEICAVAFRIKGHLKKHLRVHSGEKPYICTFCEKAFSDAWNMKCHLRIHTGEKPPHACPVCGQCFLRRNKMEEHCKLTHGEEFVLPRKQNIVQRLKNDLVEMNEDLRAISEREREDMIRQETERQLLANHFESQRQELVDQLGLPVAMPIALPVPAFPGNLPASIFGLQ